jgi:hypothetical protein
VLATAVNSDSAIQDRPLGKQLANGRDALGGRVIEHFKNVSRLLLAEHDRPLIGQLFGRHLAGFLVLNSNVSFISTSSMIPNTPKSPIDCNTKYW